jgi:hypothetical protein
MFFWVLLLSVNREVTAVLALLAKVATILYQNPCQWSHKILESENLPSPTLCMTQRGERTYPIMESICSHLKT